MNELQRQTQESFLRGAAELSLKHSGEWANKDVDKDTLVFTLVSLLGTLKNMKNFSQDISGDVDKGLALFIEYVFKDNQEHPNKRHFIEELNQNVRLVFFGFGC